LDIKELLLPESRNNYEILKKSHEALSEIILFSATASSFLKASGIEYCPIGSVLAISSLAFTAGVSFGQAYIRVKLKDYKGALVSLMGGVVLTNMANTIGVKTNIITNTEKVVLPSDRSQLCHIFKDDHLLSNTPENQKLLLDLANDKSYYVGTDERNNMWNYRFDSQGRQIWVEYRDNIIRDGGINVGDDIREFNKKTGLCRNINKK